MTASGKSLIHSGAGPALDVYRYLPKMGAVSAGGSISAKLGFSVFSRALSRISWTLP